MKYFPLFCAIVWIFSACQGGKQNMVSSQTGDTIPLRYAENLTLVAYPEYTVATLRNPWDTLRTLHTYILVPAAEPLPTGRIHYRTELFCSKRTGENRKYDIGNL